MATFNDICCSIDVDLSLLRPVEKTILNCLRNGFSHFTCPELEEIFPYTLADEQPEEYIHKLEDLLLLLLCFQKVDSHNDEIDKLKYVLKNLENHHWWQRLSLCQAITNFCRLLLKLPQKKISYHLLPSGSLPLQWSEYWSWGNVPHPCYLPLQGTLWAILAYNTKNIDILDTAENIASWHFNTLDYSHKPFIGLFSLEQDASYSLQFGYNYALFHSLALVSDDGASWEYSAQMQLNHLSNLISNASLLFPFIPLMLVDWLDNNCQKRVTPRSHSLKRMICDLNTALVGYRSKDYSLACTLYGNNTGMGSVHIGDLGIANFGPQPLPLTENKIFGLEKPCTSTHNNPPKIGVDATKNEFHLKNTVRLINSSDTKLPVRWMEAELSFMPKKLDITALFLEVVENPPLSFSFYLKTPMCTLPSGESLKPCSLNRYHGNVQPITISNSKTSLTLSTPNDIPSMEIIPLAGGDNYWGADFLVSYSLQPSFRPYSWNINLSSV